MNAGSFTEKEKNQLLRESDMMLNFDHPNVINLIGVCLDAGPSPYLVLPFMDNGSLLSYVRRSRCNLLATKETDEDKVAFNKCILKIIITQILIMDYSLIKVCIVRKRLGEMCLQIAKGMEYLTKMRIIHKDLAARNCMYVCMILCIM